MSHTRSGRASTTKTAPIEGMEVLDRLHDCSATSGCLGCWLCTVGPYTVGLQLTTHLPGPHAICTCAACAPSSSGEAGG